MRINNNMAAMNAWRNLSTNGTNMAKSLERLSSGYRINKAADDAAGLAVSEKMRAQIRGINMATRNTQDAVSLVQTAEGGASKIQDMLQRMRELAVQSGSDTLQDTDRAKLTEEFTALKAEIDRTSATVKFNGRSLLDGTSGSKASVTSGSNVVSAKVGTLAHAAFDTADQKIRVTVNGVATTQTITGQAGVMTTAPAYAAKSLDKTSATKLENIFNDGTASLLTDGTIKFQQDGKEITVNMLETDSNNTTVAEMNTQEFLDFVNGKAAAAGMAMRIDESGGNLVINSNTVGSAGNVTVTETFTNDLTFGFGTDKNLDGTANDNAFTTTGGTDADVTIEKWDADTEAWVGVTKGATEDFTVSANKITGVVDRDSNPTNGNQAGFLSGLTLDVSTTGVAEITLSKSTLDFQVGANSGEQINTSMANLSAANLDLTNLSIGTKTDSSDALKTIDEAISTVSSERAKMGAMQNRLENAISTLQTQNENLTAAESRIRDLDMAAEMAQFTKHQVLQQASTSMLAQANQLSQGVLSLLQ